MRTAVIELVIALLIIALTMPAAYAQDDDSLKQSEQAAEIETGEAVSSPLNIDKIACGTEVLQRELEGEDSTFSADTERIYCWTLITGCTEPTTVDHVWYYGGDEVARVTLDVKYPRMRTWSYKTMMPEWKGDWKVEVVSADGQPLASTEFKVE